MRNAAALANQRSDIRALSSGASIAFQPTRIYSRDNPCNGEHKKKLLQSSVVKSFRSLILSFTRQSQIVEQTVVSRNQPV